MSDNAKYYLGFSFTPDMSDGLHCTHCYFGTLNVDDLTSIITVVDTFFEATGPVKMFTPAFTVPAMFGPDKTIRVLLTSQAAFFEPMRVLRQHFIDSGFIKSEHPFRPHVTASGHSLNKPFTNYVLVKSGEIIKSWPIETLT